MTNVSETDYTSPPVRSDPNDSVARSPAGSTLGSTRGSIFSRAKMDRRVNHGDDAGEWVNMTGTRRKVLIADDDPGVLQFLSDRCAKMGFEVQTATNGLEALVIAHQSPPDVLIVDVNMPELDGLSLCARLLAPRKKPLEVVVVTGNSHPETIERCESFGAIYARKGPAFWGTVQSALMEIFPGLSHRIADVEASTARADVRERPRVLVVDDDADVGEFLCSRLRQRGVDTLLASNGIGGYRLARHDKPSLIISDYHMPHADALYLLWKLRTTPATAKIPVFIMSGRTLDLRVEANLKRDIRGRPGAARLFKKPLDIDELFGALQTFCALEHHGVDPVRVEDAAAGDRTGAWPEHRVRGTS